MRYLYLTLTSVLSIASIWSHSTKKLNPNPIFFHSSFVFVDSHRSSWVFLVFCILRLKFEKIRRRKHLKKIVWLLPNFSRLNCAMTEIVKYVHIHRRYRWGKIKFLAFSNKFIHIKCVQYIYTSAWPYTKSRHWEQNEKPIDSKFCLSISNGWQWLTCMNSKRACPAKWETKQTNEWTKQKINGNFVFCFFFKRPYDKKNCD